MSQLKKVPFSFKIHGIIQILASFYVGWVHADLWYMYHFTDVLFLFRFPDWVMVISIFLALVGVLVGFATSLKRISIVKGNLVLVGLLFIGYIVQMISLY